MDSAFVMVDVLMMSTVLESCNVIKLLLMVDLTVLEVVLMVGLMVVEVV